VLDWYSLVLVSVREFSDELERARESRRAMKHYRKKVVSVVLVTADSILRLAVFSRMCLETSSISYGGLGASRGLHGRASASAPT
jgi:hypothetical protein